MALVFGEMASIFDEAKFTISPTVYIITVLCPIHTRVDEHTKVFFTISVIQEDVVKGVIEFAKRQLIKKSCPRMRNREYFTFIGMEAHFVVQRPLVKIIDVSL